MRLRHLSRVALAAALSLQILSMVGATSARAAEPLRILILPIVVHSASADPTHVSGGLSEMIASRLEQSGRVFVERPDDANLATSHLGDALREGRVRNADFVIFGAFTQFGDGASLDIQCAPVKVASEAEAVEARRIFIQSGEVGEIIPRLDEIAGRLASYVNGGLPAPTVAASPGANVPPPRGDALREIADRLEALEEAVFGGAEENASTTTVDAPPES
jgi:hypothetical protein